VIKSGDASNMRKRAYSGLTLMAAGQGLDNALPTALMPPSELAPMQQDHMSWPKWGQYAETMGNIGEKPDMPEAEELMALYGVWMNASTLEEKGEAWRKMLRIHAEQQFVIGTVQGAMQPIVVSARLRNIPKKAIYSWEPTAMLGAYRVDQFYFAAGPTQ
jgi:peptide/nickel transport system substrate-binding protein